MPRKKLPDKNFQWTPELAYIIGLITTDGSLSKDGRHIVIVSTDLLLLEDCQKNLPFPTKITNKLPGSFSKKKTYKIQFSNVQFYKWLLKIGLFPNKTYTVGILDIPYKYFRDFLRGHLDGDGDITVYTDYYNTFKNKKYVYKRIYTRFTSASQNHILWLRKIIQKLTGINGRINHWLRKDRIFPQWRLRFAKKESLQLLNWLYYDNDIPCLKRKRVIFDQFVALEKPEIDTKF